MTVDLPKVTSAASRTRQRLMASTAYEAADFDHPSMETWRPFNWSGQSATSLGRETIAARLHDLVRNDGWASAAVSRFVDETIGSGWRLSAKPNAAVLGIDEETADAIADRIEALWSDVVNDHGNWIDAERDCSFGGLLGLGMRHRFIDGQAAAHILWRPAPTGWATCVHVFDPARISNPLGMMDTDVLQSGCELDGFGADVAYHIRRRHPGDSVFTGLADGWVWDRVEREVETVPGYLRPQVVRAFEKTRAGEKAPFAALVSALRKHKQVADYDKHELEAASLNAVLGAFVTSPFDLEELAETFGANDTSIAKTIKAYGDSQSAYYEEAPIRLPGVRLNFLRPGEEPKFLAPAHPNANFEAFQRTALRSIASALGMTYESLTMDWSQVNYSSARAALMVIHRALSSRSDRFAHSFAQPIYVAWLEEVFESGLIELPDGVPGFYDAPVAWSRADWIGPARGWVDPEKEAKASVIRMATGQSTLEDESVSQGRDWKEGIRQKAREKRFADRNGVVLDGVNAVAVAAAGAPQVNGGQQS